MVRSISEVQLFKEGEDKDRYLMTLKRYQSVFDFKVYAYCIMDTHAHLIIYANGADISKIMHGLNLSYAQYFNRKYGRHGHLFQDRFKSKIIDTDSYLAALSGYIHNNPTDIPGYRDRVEDYPYSSLGVYLGKAKDIFKLLDVSFVLGHFGKNILLARRQYVEFMKCCTDINELPQIEFKNEITEYRSQRHMLIRGFSIDDITKYISEKMGIEEIFLKAKYRREFTEARAVCVLFMRSFCDMKYKDICKVLGNVTQSRASKLCSMGVDIVQREGGSYKEIVLEFAEKYKAVQE